MNITHTPIVAANDAPLRFPCSASQERFWFLDQMKPGDPALNVAFRWNVEGRFSAAAFEAAFKAVIARHEVLRTRFIEVSGRPMQEVMPTAPFRLSEIDIRTTPQAQQLARIDQIAQDSAAQSFDLTQPGHLRVSLIRLGNDRAIMAISVHHICFDGWSIGVLGREIGAFAAAFDAGETISLPELPLQFGDYAMWQEEYLASDAFRADLAPVCDQLRDAPYFELTPDFPRPLQRTTTCGRIDVDVPAAWGDKLEAAARARSMSPFTFGAGVLSALFARVADTDELLIGSQVAGRTETDVEPLIGVFINNIVLRFRTRQDMTLGDHLDQGRKAVTDALAGQNVPYSKVVETLNPPRDPARTPLVSVNFILQPVFMESTTYGNFKLSSAPSQAPGAIHDLNFLLIGRANGWRITLEYNSDLFSQDTAADIVGRLQEAFDIAFDAPERLLSQMPELQHASLEQTEETARIKLLETVLSAHEAVADIATVPLTDADGNRRLHAFVTLSHEAPLMPLETLPAMLRDHLQQAAPDLSYPIGISLLQSLPRNADGRIAKTRLPTAVAARTGASNPIAPVRLSDTAPDHTKNRDGAAAIKAKLEPIWADILGLDDVPHGKSFFDLGGHSLLIIRLISRIETAFGRRISLANVFENPTFNGLAQHLADGSQPAIKMSPDTDWRVLVLREGGAGIPLIAINNATITYAMTAAMTRKRPAVSLRIYDKQRGDKLEPLGFEQIAAAFKKAVRAAQPHGPYAFFGVCVHGNLAIEIARQLRAEGEEVAAVIMKDVWEPRYARRIDQNVWTRRRNQLHFLKVRLKLLARRETSLSTFLGTFSLFRNSGALDAAVRIGLMERVRNMDDTAEQEEFITYLTAARDVHQPAPFDGRVLHLVTGISPTGRGFDPTIGWGDLVTGEMETRYIDHLSATRGRNDGIEQAAALIEETLAGYDLSSQTAGGQRNAK